MTSLRRGFVSKINIYVGFWRELDTSEFLHVADRKNVGDLHTECVECDGVLFTVIPKCITAENLNQLRTEPAESDLHLFEVVQDRVVG